MDYNEWILSEARKKLEQRGKVSCQKDCIIAITGLRVDADMARHILSDLERDGDIHRKNRRSRVRISIL